MFFESDSFANWERIRARVAKPQMQPAELRKSERLRVSSLSCDISICGSSQLNALSTKLLDYLLSVCFCADEGRGMLGLAGERHSEFWVLDGRKGVF